MQKQSRGEKGGGSVGKFCGFRLFRQRMTANMRDLGEIFERTYPKRLDFPEMSAIMYMDKYVLQGRGCSVMHPQSAVIFMEEDILSDTHKPLMLEAVLFCPILNG